MKRQTRRILSLAVILLLCGGAYFGLRAWNAGQEAREEEGEEAVSVTALGEITTLSFENDEGTTLAFEQRNGVWSYRDDPAFPLEQSYLETLEGILADLTAVRSFAAADALADYGLEEPAQTVFAETADGETLTLYIGDSIGANYYARLEGGDVVYTIDGTLVSGTSYTLLEMAVIEEFPALSEETLERVTVETEGVGVTLRKETAAHEEEIQVDTGETDENGNPVYETETETTYTYTWYLVTEGGDVEIPAESAVLADYQRTLSALAFSACVHYNVDDAAISDCGLDVPDVVTVAYEDGAVTLYIGEKDEAGDYYAMLEGSSAIYSLSAAQAEAILGLDEAMLKADGADAS